MELSGSRKVNIDIDTLSVLYRHYKNYLLPLGVIACCFLVLFFIVIPQTQQYLSNSDTLKAETQKLDDLKNNYNFLVNLDEAKTDDQLKTLSAVLPPDKDFAGVMNSISSTAGKTNVSVGNFSFTVGDLSSVSQIGSLYPNFQVLLTLQGDSGSIINFISQIYKTAPVAEINIIKLQSGSANITLLFYYKPFASQNISDSQSVQSLSPASQTLISDLSAWGNLEGQNQLPLSTNGLSGASSSGGINYEPF